MDIANKEIVTKKYFVNQLVDVALISCIIIIVLYLFMIALSRATFALSGSELIALLAVLILIIGSIFHTRSRIKELHDRINKLTGEK